MGVDGRVRRPDHSTVATAPDPQRAVVIASPLASRIRDASARRRVIRLATQALAARGYAAVEVVEAGEPAAIRAAVEAAVSDGVATVVLAGGDGTVRDASGALARTGTAVGILPCGTGNLYAASVGIPRSVDEAIAVLATGSPGAFDLGELVVERPGAPPEAWPFVVACGTGFDAHVIAATSREAKRRYGVAAYVLAASRVTEHLRPQPTVVTVDGQRTELESVAVLVASTGEGIPGGLRPRMPVRADDGLLHVFVLPRGGILRNLRGALELLAAEGVGTTASGAGIRLVGRTVRVEVDPPAPIEVDGDLVPPAVIEARIRPGALAVIRP
jgi:diacylglycerol kinase (ATP)